jgi:hypothetical protein
MGMPPNASHDRLRKLGWANAGLRRAIGPLFKCKRKPDKLKLGHSPLPWHIVSRPEEDLIDILDANGDLVVWHLFNGNVSNFNLIVDAVNSYKAKEPAP